ncbi:transmembrane protein 216 isoform X1 [Myiozetetes cayanensis]|uniref:transmembrane protein 216 isoform X1 n=1 Tax=Myiozetetes cayanensis TaxID=478635 RepID=UPI00215FEEBB|nr:transmembrane protein 216 isoform X1 [Myiozetetes cayanensis]
MAPRGRHRSSVPLQILLFLNGWYSATYFLLEAFVFVYKVLLLPYPVSNLVLDVVLLLLYLGTEATRIFFAFQDSMDTGKKFFPVSAARHQNEFPREAAAAPSLEVLTATLEQPGVAEGVPDPVYPAGSKGNLCRRKVPLSLSLALTVPAAALASYYLLLQTYSLRLEFFLSAILLLFYGLELLLGLLALLSFSSADPY